MIVKDLDKVLLGFTQVKMRCRNYEETCSWMCIRNNAAWCNKTIIDIAPVENVLVINCY